MLNFAKRWFVAEYTLSKNIGVIDFSGLPSVFEPDLYENRHNRFFLHEFIRELTSPVKKNGKEHVDYVL